VLKEVFKELNRLLDTLYYRIDKTDTLIFLKEKVSEYSVDFVREDREVKEYTPVYKRVLWWRKK
jgi:hypothetical protein